MADINVERRSRSIWPWLIGLLVLAALAWLLLSMFSGDDDRDDVRVEETSTSLLLAPSLERAA